MQRWTIACIVIALMAQMGWADASSLISQSASDITKGSRIQTTADGFSVRDSYGVDDEKNIKLKLSREIIKGDTGVVTDGPQEADGYVWWKIKYDFDGAEGWSVERSLTNPDIKYLEPESVPNQPENFEGWRDKAIDWATKLYQKNPSSEAYYALCLKFVASAFQQKPDGASGYVIPNHEMPYALDVAKDLHRFNQEPNGWEKAPVGALIFFDKTASNDAGHIGFKNKDGRLIESYGKIRLDTIINDKSFLARGDVGKYIGWSYPPDTWSPPPEIKSPGQNSEPGENIGDTLTPTFKWKKAPNAEYYALYIRNEPFEESNKGPIVFNSENDYGLIKGDIQGSYLAFSLPSKYQLETGKKYRWNMCAVSNSGSGVRGGHLKSGISDTLYFETGSQGNSQGESQSSASTLAGTDTTNPVVQSFQVTPQSVSLGESFTIDYTVSDSGGSGLKQVELWRKDEASDWQQISTNMLAGETGPLTGTFTDSPSASGKYWYGVHVVDNAGNWNNERNSNTKGQPSGFEPVKVEVQEAASAKVAPQAHAEEWNKTFGNGVLYSVLYSDNGYVAAGYTGVQGYEEALLIRVADNGNEIWRKTFGGAKSDLAFSVYLTNDGGYLLNGNTKSFDLPGGYYGAAWLIKTDPLGNEIWNRSFIGTAYNKFSSIQPTPDGGCVIAAGGRNIADIRIHNRYASIGDEDAWLIKIDSAGNEVWSRNFDPFNLKGDDFANSVTPASDGGYFLAGRSGFGDFNYYDWVIKTDSRGNEIWNRTLTETEHRKFNDWQGVTSYSGWVQVGSGFRFKKDGGLVTSILSTTDGAYVLAGSRPDSHGTGWNDAWLIKIDSNGNELLNKTFGGKGDDEADLIRPALDSGYILGGVTRYTGDGNFETWLVKVDSEGNKLWNKTFGGRGSYRGDLIQLTRDGGCILKGTTSYGGDPYNRFDTWIINIDSEGKVIWNRTFSALGNIKAYSVLSTTDGGCIVAGTSSGKAWLTKIDAGDVTNTS